MPGCRALLRTRPAAPRTSGMGYRFAQRFCVVDGERSFQLSTRSRKTFHQLVTLPDAGIPLAETALILACEEYPQLELAPYLEELDQMAEAVQKVRAPSD